MSHAVKITKIKKLDPTTLVRYDIQVDKTKNFFANDVLVHNCRVLMTVIWAEDGDIPIISFSRNGKVFENFTHIEDQVRKNALKLIRASGMTKALAQGFVLDGEMIGDSFQELMRQARRKKNAQADDSVFNLFDIIPLQEFRAGLWKTPLSKRIEMLEKMRPVIDTMTNVELLPHIMVDLDTAAGRDQMHRYGQDMVKAGFEGIMVKDCEAPYECKRTVSWLKWKPTLDVDLQVVGMEEGTGKNVGRMGALICHGNDHGKEITVNCGSGFTDKERQEYWDNKNSVIGRSVVILCDVITLNQDGTYSLRFPRFKTFRYDK